MDKKRIPLLQNLTEEEFASIEQTAATSEQLFEKRLYVKCWGVIL